MARLLPKLSLISVLIAMATAIPQASAQSHNCNYIFMVCGNSASNTLVGTYNTDWMFAGGGNDTLRSSAKWDYMSGGEGYDTVSYANSPSRVVVSLDPDARGIGGYAEGDYLSSIENIIGSNYADILEGGSDQSEIRGGSGNDYIFAGPGGGRFYGGGGNDIIYSPATTNPYRSLFIYGGEGDDRIIVRGGRVRPYGGRGNNIYIITRDVEEVEINLSNYLGRDKIDLRAWPEIRNLIDLETKWKLRYFEDFYYEHIKYVFTINAATGQSMTIYQDVSYDEESGLWLSPDDFIFASR